MSFVEVIFGHLIVAGIVRYPAAGTPKAKVVTYWSCASARDARGADFRRAAGFTTDAIVGVQGDLREQNVAGGKTQGSGLVLSVRA